MNQEKDARNKIDFVIRHRSMLKEGPREKAIELYRKKEKYTDDEINIIKNKLYEIAMQGVTEKLTGEKMPRYTLKHDLKKRY
jgi:hypothetical protein